MSSYIVYRKLKGSETVAIEDLIIVKQPQDGIIIKADSDLSKDVVGVPVNWLIAPEDDHRLLNQSDMQDSVMWGFLYVVMFLICVCLLDFFDNKIHSGLLVFASAMASVEIIRALRRLCE